MVCKKKGTVNNDRSLTFHQITRWAAYPSSQVLLRVCREPFRPLQFESLSILCAIIVIYSRLFVKFF